MPDGYLIVILALAFVAAFLGVVWAARYRRRLGGTLTVYRSGHIIHEVSLTGRRFELDQSSAGVKARVKPQKSDADGRSRIAVIVPGAKRPTVLADGQGHELGDVFVEYQDHRSRAVARITPEQPTRPRRRAADSDAALLGGEDLPSGPGSLGRHVQPSAEDSAGHHAGPEGELGSPPLSPGQRDQRPRAPHDETHRDSTPHEPPSQPPE